METNNSDTNKNRETVSYAKNSEDPSNTTHTKKTRKLDLPLYFQTSVIT